MRILGIETSSNAATAAVFQDGALLAEYTLNHKKTHSETMQPAVLKILDDLGIALSDIDVFAVGVGPGSFTGLRIGVSMVKGFAQSLNKPVAGISTLSALSENVNGFSGTKVSLIFARADEVFYGIYDDTEKEEGVCTIDELLKKLKNKKCIFCGDGSSLFKEKITAALGDSAVFANARQNVVSAASVCILAEKAANEGKLLSCFELSPVYMRPSQAEREFG